MIEQNKFLVAAQELRDQLDKAKQLQAFLLDEFDPQYLDPSVNHLLLPNIRVRGVATTNYDTLIEKAYESQNGSSPYVLHMDELDKANLPYLDDQFFIFKMHGQYDRDVVLGTRDYQNAMYSLPEYRYFVSWLFFTYTMLIIGFSGDDPHLGSIIDQLSAWYPKSHLTHYLLLEKGRFNPVECRRWEEDRHIRVIQYDKPSPSDYSQVNAFLRELVALDCKKLKKSPFKP